MRIRAVWLVAFVALLFALPLPRVGAQSAQFDQFVHQPNTWTARQTFNGGITVTSCTGCGGGSAITSLTGPVTATGPGAAATTIGALAVLDANINSLVWSKITSTPTTVAGYGISSSDTPSFLTVNLGEDRTTLAMAATKNYVDTSIASVNVGGATANSFLVGGGQVTWASNFNFTVSASTYYLIGVLTTSTQQTVTLAAADPTNPRIDLIVLDNTGTASRITGTPAATPSQPSYDPSTQLPLTFVTVAANATQPASVVNTLLYQSNVGSPTEWNWSPSGTGIVTNSTNNPLSPGTHTIEATNMANNATATGQIGSGSFDPNTANFLIVWIESKATWANKRTLVVSLESTGVLTGSPITIATGAYGFNSSTTASYQQIAIPTSQFAVPTGTTINQVQLRDAGGAIGFYIGLVQFQGGVTTPAVQGITQTQADARYRLLSVALNLASSSDVIGNLAIGNIVTSTNRDSSHFLRGDGSWQTVGGGAALSGITAATGSNTIANGNNSGQIWNWALTTNAVTAFTFGETTAATNGIGNSQSIVGISTLALSTAVPLTVTNLGNSNTAIFTKGSGVTTTIGGSNGTMAIVGGAGAQEATFSNGTAIMEIFQGQTIGTTTSSDFNLEVGGTIVMRLKSGAAITMARTPSTALSVAATQAVVGNSADATGVGKFWGIGYGFASTNYPAYAGFIETSDTGSTDGDFIIATRNATTDIAPTERMRITHDAFVGIGTSGPGSKLTVSDSATPVDFIRVLAGSGANANILTIDRDNSSSPTNNDGAGVLFRLKQTDGTIAQVGLIQALILDVTNNNATGALSFQTKLTGAPGSIFPTEAMRLDAQHTMILSSTTPTPAVTNTTSNSCGTTAATIAGNNNVGTITVGATAGSSCTVTFTTTAPNAWVCHIEDQTTANLIQATPSRTTVTIAKGTMVAGDKLDYMCFAR